MYTVVKTLEISAAHSLTLDYGSKCENLHGHNWKIRVFCRAEELDHNGMVTDFTLIKRKICDRLDHTNLNDVLSFNPTAENMARWICGEIPNCYRVEVAESLDNMAVYEKG